MACKGLGVLIDTCIFIGWWDHEPEYSSLDELINNESFYIVICEKLQHEYLDQMKKRYAGASFHLWQSIYEKFRFEWASPISESQFRMNDEKDQPHLDCAHNREHPAHILISDDKHFLDIKEEDVPIPIILSFTDFMCDNTRQNACSQAKKIMAMIRQYGLKHVFHNGA